VVVDFKTLCNCIDYSERYIKDLKKQGVIVSAGTNKYKLEESLINVQKYLKELIEKEKEKSGEPTDIGAGIFAEKRKLTKEQRIKLELENRLRKGELFEASIVEEVYSRDLITVKTKLEDLPKSMSVDLSRETDPLKCEVILSDKIREALQELSQYDSKLFYKDDERLLESEEVAE